MFINKLQAWYITTLNQRTFCTKVSTTTAKSWSVTLAFPRWRTWVSWVSFFTGNGVWKILHKYLQHFRCNVTRRSTSSGHDTRILHLGEAEVTDHDFAVLVGTVIQKVLRFKVAVYHACNLLIQIFRLSDFQEDIFLIPFYFLIIVVKAGILVKNFRRKTIYVRLNFLT